MWMIHMMGRVYYHPPHPRPWWSFRSSHSYSVEVAIKLSCSQCLSSGRAVWSSSHFGVSYGTVFKLGLWGWFTALEWKDSSSAFQILGKDRIIFVTKEDHETPSSAELVADDPNDPYEEHGEWPGPPRDPQVYTGGKVQYSKFLSNFVLAKAGFSGIYHNHGPCLRTVSLSPSEV